MIMPANMLEQIVSHTDWCKPWVKRGMICVRVPADDPKGFADFELKNRDVPNTALLVGSGGWDENGALHWVGVDLDVGHGQEKSKYQTREEAINTALQLRAFVNNAAEVRLSKSGKGVHVRVAIEGVMADGRTMAARIAKWLANTLEIKSDRTVLGRQNLWFWARERGEESFQEIAPCVGRWTPPPAALKPETATAPTTPAAPIPWWHEKAGVVKRAEAYIRKVPPSVSGSGGHNQAFKAACALLKGFALNIDDARPLFYLWNQGCQPPWSEKELEHKLNDAAKARGDRGYLLIPKPEAFKPTKAEEIVPEFRPSDKVKQQLQDEQTGKRFAAMWPWPMLHKLTLALLPGSMTIYCAPPGSSKSFFMLQAVAFWMERGYRPAILELEENRTYHLRRALAQVCGDSSITDPEWVKANASQADSYVNDHSVFLDKLSECIFEAPKAFSTKDALIWLREMVASNRRVIAIDPITARDPSERPWIDDQYFVRGAEDIIRDADTSLVLVTHPPKNPKDTSLDNVAGGAAYQRFSQVIIWMEACDAEEVSCGVFGGNLVKTINRKAHLRKTRNGRAQNTCLGFYFNGKTLKFEECGIVPKE